MPDISFRGRITVDGMIWALMLETVLRKTTLPQFLNRRDFIVIGRADNKSVNVLNSKLEW